MHFLQNYLTQIRTLCQRHHVQQLHVFGSVLTSNFDDESDIDFVVRFKKMDVAQYADNYFQLKFSLEDLLHRSIDLLEEHSLNNPYFLQQVEATKQRLYG